MWVRKDLKNLLKKAEGRRQRADGEASPLGRRDN
jgi:hypothetical protein